MKQQCSADSVPRDNKSLLPTSAWCGPTARATRRGSNAKAVALGGSHFCFSGGANEGILVWDLRMTGRSLYELTTGNNIVDSLSWDAATNTLLAATYNVDGTSRILSEGDFDDDNENDDRDWPVDALHQPCDFGYRFNVRGEPSVFEYRFTSEPDLTICPHSDCPDPFADIDFSALMAVPIGAAGV
jgi:hypothetical protein